MWQMKSAKAKNFLREIRNNMGRFLSIFLIVLVGTAFFAGLRASGTDMKYLADKYYRESSLMDIRVISTLGLTDEDIDDLKDMEEVETAEGACTADVLVEYEQELKVVKVIGETEKINLPNLTEGRMPEKKNECAVDFALVKNIGYGIGDTLEVRSGTSDDIEETLNVTKFTITGICGLPYYIDLTRGSSNIGNGNVEGFLIVSPEVFESDVYSEGYLKLKGTEELYAFGEEYDKTVDAAKDHIEEIMEACGKRRYEEIVSDAEEEIGENERKIADAEAELADAKAELDDGEKDLAEAKAELADARDELDDAKAELADAKKELTDAKAELDDGKKELDDAKARLDDGRRQIAEAEEQLQDSRDELAAGRAQYNTGKAELEAGRAALDAGWQQYNAGQEEIAEAEEELAAGRAALEAGQAEYEAGLAQYLEQKAAYEAGEEQYAAGMAALELYPENEELRAQMEALRAELDAAAAALSEAETELLAAKELLDEKEAELSAGEAELAAAKEQAAAACETLSAKEAELSAGEEQLAASLEELNEGERQLASGAAVLEEKKRELAAGEQEYNDGLADYEEGLAKYEDGLAEYNDGFAEYEDGLAEYEEGLAEYEEGLADWQDGKKEYDDNYGDAIEEIEDGKRKLADAREELADLEEPDTYVLGRDKVASLASFDGDADRMDKLGEVFPVIFFLVAALVSLTAMTRMVEEQRLEIGTLKALGSSDASVALKYLLYAFLATAGGGIAGVFIGQRIIPVVVIDAYHSLYTGIPMGDYPFNTFWAVIAVIAAIACTTIATLFACYRALRDKPAVLMRPEAPKGGSRVLFEHIPGLWKKLNFSKKATIRNLFRYKKRLFMTIIGIGGCMGLMLVGYGIQDSITGIAVKQYVEIFSQDVTVTLNDQASEEERDELFRTAAEYESVTDCTEAAKIAVTLTANDTDRSAYLFIPKDPAEAENYVRLKDRLQDVYYSFPEEGAIITEKAADMLGVSRGDRVQIRLPDDEDSAWVTITDIVENYVLHYLYLTPGTYEELFGEEPEYNEILLKFDRAGDTAFEQKMGETFIASDACSEVEFVTDLKDRIDEMLDSLHLVMWVLIIFSAFLAFVVLYNLNSINITERKRELATLKVLGFHDTEVAMYIYRENLILTVIGIVVGVFIGIVLHRYLITTVEVDLMMFGRKINTSSFLVCALWTGLFSLGVNLMMYWHFKKIDMIESLKSVE